MLNVESLLANYLFGKHFSRKKRAVKGRAFDGFTSACHIDGLRPEEVEAIAQEYVAPGRAPASLKGWAELTVGDVESVGLRAVRDNVNYERHVEISGWPGRGPGPVDEESKARRMSIEKELASLSRLVLLEGL